MTGQFAAAFAGAKTMEELYSVLSEAGMGPGWNKPTPSLWPAPRENFVPAHWSYADAKPALDAAGRFVRTELAERRNLILNNPVPGNDYATARTLVAAYQMVKGNETARSHRHSPNALRLLIDAAPNTYTVVEGKKIPMEHGDVLLTPNWLWHGHANENDQDAYWIDFLDVPVVHFLESMFMENYTDFIEQTEIVDAQSAFRFAFTETCSRLDSTEEVGDGVRRIELGPPRLDTIALHLSRIEKLKTAAGERSTANSIYAVIDGAGRSDIDGVNFEWRRGDVFVVPSWRPSRHVAEATSYLLRVSDEPLMKKLNWFRQA